MNEPTPETMDAVVSELGQLLRRVLEGGFQVPIHFAAIGANGSQMIGTFEQGPGGTLTPRFHHTHTVGGGLSLPINLFLVDSQGETARARFERGETPNLEFLN